MLCKWLPASRSCFACRGLATQQPSSAMKAASAGLVGVSALGGLLGVMSRGLPFSPVQRLAVCCLPPVGPYPPPQGRAAWVRCTGWSGLCRGKWKRGMQSRGLGQPHQAIGFWGSLAQTGPTPALTWLITLLRRVQSEPHSGTGHAASSAQWIESPPSCWGKGTGEWFSGGHVGGAEQ